MDEKEIKKIIKKKFKEIGNKQNDACKKIYWIDRFLTGLEKMDVDTTNIFSEILSKLY